MSEESTQLANNAEAKGFLPEYRDDFHGSQDGRVPAQ